MICGVQLGAGLAPLVTHVPYEQEQILQFIVATTAPGLRSLGAFLPPFLILCLSSAVLSNTSNAI